MPVLPIVRLPLPGRALILALLLLAAAMPEPVAAAHDGMPLRLGHTHFIAEATTVHALARGYFAAEGLDIEVTTTRAGKYSLQKVMRGELDIGTLAPTPAVYAAAGRYGTPGSFVIVASILESSSMNNLVMPRGRGLESVKDLEGRRLGLTKGTSSEYFWYLLALASDVDRDRVAIRDLPVSAMVEALQDGSIDAAIAWTPYDATIAEALPQGARIMNGNYIYTTSWLVVARPTFVERHREAVIKYLRALLRAERDLKARPERVAASQSDHFGLGSEQIAERYGQLDFHLQLTESLIANLSVQAQWAVEAGYAPGPVPDMRRYVDPRPLRAVRPQAVRLFE